MSARGRSRKAQQVLRRLDDLQKAIPSSENQNNFHDLEGEIFSPRPNHNRLRFPFQSLLQAFAPFISSTGLARAYQAEGRWDLAAREWEKVLGEKGEILQNGFPPDLAIAHIELARVYRQMNNRDLARKHYEEALRMWQHADEFTAASGCPTRVAGIGPRSRPFRENTSQDYSRSL